ncbi:MAG: glycosyltransferase family 4 protein [bacterium]
MRVRKVLLTTPYDISIPGGVNGQLWGLVAALEKHADVELKVVGPRSRRDDAVHPAFVPMGRVLPWKINGSVANLTIDPITNWRVGRLLRSFAPDVVHLQEPLVPLLNTAVMWHSRAGNVGTYHTFSETSQWYRRAKLFLGWQHQRVHRKIAVSRAAADFVSRAFPDHYTIIPNACAPVPIVELPDGKSLGSPVTILFIGRMDEERKGFGYLVEAFDLLERRHPGGFRLVAVGAGAEQWRSLPGARRIEWCGEVTGERLRELFREADLLCAPSIGGESFGMVLLEALGYGVPVVASAIRGYEDFLRGCDAAFLARPRDPVSLVDCIEDVAKDEARYAQLRRSGRAHAEKFQWSSTIVSILELYEEAADIARRRGS